MLLFNEKIIFLGNDWKNRNVSRNSLSKEWFINVKLLMLNIFLEKIWLLKKFFIVVEYL